jgi:hypothetical protein
MNEGGEVIQPVEISTAEYSIELITELGTDLQPDRGTRQQWTHEQRAVYRANMPPSVPVPQSVQQFDRLLTAALGEARRRQWSVAVLVLHIPALTKLDTRRQRDIEMALRLDLRQGDVLARLSNTCIAVSMPETDLGATTVAARFKRTLRQMMDEEVGSAVAFYPQDGDTSRELLRRATQRCLTGCPHRPPDQKLAWLLETDVTA